MPLATLGSSIIDGLVPTVDAIRDSVNTIAGNRQYRVFLVKRHWSGAQRGDGTPTLTVQEIIPRPRVDWMSDRTHYELKAQGLEEEGNLTLSEVSLTFTEAELTGADAAHPIAHVDEFYYRLVEGMGQATRTRYYTPDRPPMPDREKDLGWRITLRRIEVEET